MAADRILLRYGVSHDAVRALRTAALASGDVLTVEDCDAVLTRQWGTSSTAHRVVEAVRRQRTRT